MAKKERIIDRSKKVELGLDELMSDRFGRYSKYIIQERALPDGRDGLKPVQRRILYAMWEDGNTFEKAHRKSAKAVGYIIGYYHPHGDTSVYDAIVRLSQDFKMNIPLVDMQGNNGSIDDDPPAAMRYTEARLSKIASGMLEDIDKDCVNFTNNYDDTTTEPTVLPLRFPLLLVNGSTGIASGYATNIPPHNLKEIIDATIYRINNPDSTTDDLMQFVKGPDFPTGGIVQGIENIKEVFKTGRGKIVLRAKCDILELRTLKQIVITEIPYEVVKVQLVKKIDDIRLNHDIDGIIDVRDESGRDGLRIVIDVKKEQDAKLILNYLYKNTDLQINYSYNMIAISNHRPVLLNLESALDTFIEFRKETVIKRTNYLLNKKNDRLNIIEGLIKAISILDDVIEIIRRSKDKADAKARLIEAYLFTERQAEAIVNLRLYRLSNTDIRILKEEYASLTKEINDLNSILGSEVVLNNLIINELKSIANDYGTDRKTKIEAQVSDINIEKEAMIINEKVMISVSKDGYVKRSSIRSFTSSDSKLPGFKEGDKLIGFTEAEMLDTLLLFTNKGNFAYIPLYTIDEYKWRDIGKHFSNYARSEGDDKIVDAFVVKNFDTYLYVTLVSKKGMIKKTLLRDLKVTRYNKVMKIMNLSDDEVIGAKITKNDTSVCIVTENGYYNHYQTAVVAASSPRSKGIRGIGLKDDFVADFAIFDDKSENLLVVREDGQMKRLRYDDLEMTTRGTKGSRLAKPLKTRSFKVSKVFNVISYDTLLIYDKTLHELNVASVPIMTKEATYSTALSIDKDFFILKNSDKGMPVAPIVDFPSDFTDDNSKVEQVDLFEELNDE